MYGGHSSGLQTYIHSAIYVQIPQEFHSYVSQELRTQAREQVPNETSKYFLEYDRPQETAAITRAGACTRRAASAGAAARKKEAASRKTAAGTKAVDSLIKQSPNNQSTNPTWAL